MPRVIHFEITADNPERAVDFYKSVFDWDISTWGGPMPYWLIKTGEDNEPGINGAIMGRHELNAPVVNTIDVPRFEEFAAKILAAGGEQCTPKHPIPGVGYFAYFKDTEGNLFGIMENDTAAK
jgi:uncharacterized protein